MNTLTIIAVALGLAMDAFAVAVAGSITIGRITGRQIFRFAFHFGLFQAMMPVLGWFAGRSARHYIEDVDHWIAFALLAIIGGKAIRDALISDDEKANRSDPTKGMSLIMFSVATSIDALAVGLSLAIVGTEIFYPALIIGVVTAAVTVVGMTFGSRLGRRFGKRMEIAGGLVLIVIGIKILIEHLA
jgi:manganese efflux pump family protein